MLNDFSRDLFEKKPKSRRSPSGEKQVIGSGGVIHLRNDYAAHKTDNQLKLNTNEDQVYFPVITATVSP